MSVTGHRYVHTMDMVARCDPGSDRRRLEAAEQKRGFENAVDDKLGIAGKRGPTCGIASSSTVILISAQHLKSSSVDVQQIQDYAAGADKTTLYNIVAVSRSFPA